MLQKFWALALSGLLMLSSGCSSPQEDSHSGLPAGDEVAVVLSDSGVTVDGQAASADPASSVYVGADIIYYHDGTDETYGEGDESEKHSPAEAAAHQVVTIAQPGTYRLSGSLSKGQISVDLGEGAKDDPSAVVTLILDNVDVTCAVAPALIFYNVYECDREWVSYDKGENPDYQASADVDTTKAGANVVLAAGSVNTFTGSHVARIYQEGTTKKLHKYDGAVFSKMSVNIFGDNGDDSGVWNIAGDKEGLETALHLTLNGGTVNVTSQDDGVNSNEDNVSVTTINGGSLTVNAGNGAEGDGIDSNGHLVINGGSVVAFASDHSPDGGVDADGDILINGGTLVAFGVRNEAVSGDSQQAFLELFLSSLSAGSALELKDGEENVVWSATAQGSHQALTLSLPALTAGGDYRLYVDGVLQENSGHGFGHGGMGFPGGGRPGDGQTPPEPPEGFDPSQFDTQRPQRPDGQRPEPPEGFDPNQFDGQRPQREPGGRPGGPGRGESGGENSSDTEAPADALSSATTS